MLVVQKLRKAQEPKSNSKMFSSWWVFHCGAAAARVEGLRRSPRGLLHVHEHYNSRQRASVPGQALACIWLPEAICQILAVLESTVSCTRTTTVGLVTSAPMLFYVGHGPYTDRHEAYEGPASTETWGRGAMHKNLLSEYLFI